MPCLLICFLIVETRHDFAYDVGAEFNHDDHPLLKPEHALDNIKVEYHLSSGIEVKVYPFNSFHHHPMASSEVPHSAEPWCPFQSCLEFEVAELALEADLNNQKTNQLIKLCHCCIVGKEKFTFKTHKDIQIKWEAVSVCVTKFMKEVISVPCDGKIDLLGDPHIFLHFTFNTQCLSKFDRDTFIHFMDEPFTMQDFWNVQSQLPPDEKPLAFILYADKMRLSSFGTAKGYPVILEDKDYAGKPSWVNFKNTVWHKSFCRITALLALKSKMGQWFACMDGVLHWFFLCMLILCVILWPCPICLTFMHQTANDSCAAVMAAQTKDTLEEKEVILKNALWDIQYSDVHRSLLHDCCHYNHGGLWSYHYWVELQKDIVGLGRAKVSQVDKDLRHPNQVMSVLFADSAMHKDISKMIIYATHNILMEDESPLGYLLLKGRSAVQALTALMKDWIFSKLHMIMHLFNDIEAKGASRNYNTKLNEQMHGPLKDWYQNWTNFKNIDHWVHVADDICCCISDMDNYISLTLQSQDNNNNNNKDAQLPMSNLLPLNDGSLHVKLGSRQVLQTFSHIEDTCWNDDEFMNFCIRLNSFLNITKYQFLQVNFKSLVDWQQHMEYLQCNLSFHNSPHFDCVFIHTNEKVIVGHLLFLFKCPVGKDLYPLALIHPFDAPTGT
ncbi:hypothetical protein BDR04DRAFT_1129523 [Suillus decipiens]|nr:hypothetical protein BDR04DRAFT_1129523 [Suillus decipiens]